MLAILPLVFFLLLCLIFHRIGNGWRSSFLSAAIGWGVLVAALTEILSLFKILVLSWVLGTWLAFIIVLIIIYFYLIRNKNKIANQTINYQVPAISFLLLSGIAFILATVGLIALVAPPNNMDSMTYHMARIMHWIQNHSVAHYSTHYPPQLYHPPWAEFAIMHLQILSGGDRFANLIQWFSMVGSIFGVSLIAKQLGANFHGQVLAAALCATIPMGILQGSSTQNDYVVCFWLVCFVYYILLTIKEGINWTKSLTIGASLGLAFFTKTTAYFYGFPFLVWFIFIALKRERWKSWQPISVIGIVIFALNINHYLRNFDLFSSFLGAPPKYVQEYKIVEFTIPLFISNVIKNLALHLDIVRSLGVQSIITPLTGKAEKAILLLHELLGVDVNDPRITSPPDSFSVPGLSFNESIAGNPIHFFLIGLVIALYLSNKTFKKEKYLTIYQLCITGAFLLFCLLIKWQPFQSRHHLSIFVLFSAFIGVVLSKVWNYRIVNTLALIFMILSLPWVFHNKFRPIVGDSNIFNTSRIEQYHINRPDLTEPSVGAVNFIRAKGCSDIGLVSEWEYPLWVLLQEKNDKLVRIENVNVDNVSAVKMKEDFIPCAILFLDLSVNKDKKKRAQKEIVVRKDTYLREWFAGSIRVFVRQRVLSQATK